MKVFKFSNVGSFEIKQLEKGNYRFIRKFRKLISTIDMGCLISNYFWYKENSYLWLPDIKTNQFFNSFENNSLSIVLDINTEKKIKNIFPIYNNSLIIGFEIFFDTEKIILFKSYKNIRIYSEYISYTGMYYKDGILKEIIKIKEQN